MISLTEENYLKALFLLSQNKEDVSINELSKHLKIKMPTANSMIKRLAEKKYVQYESYKPLKLTSKGKKEAALILRKHRLTEMFLVQVLGLGWEEVHHIAEQIEHIQSVTFFDKMDLLLGHPNFDPHGSPIPDKDGKLPSINYLALSDCHINQTVVLAAVLDSSEDFLRYLNSKFIKLGNSIAIKHIEDYDGTMTIIMDNQTTLTLSKTVSKKLLVHT